MIRKMMAAILAGCGLALLGLAQFAAADDCCPTECCPKKVCIPTTETKKIEHRCYNSKCEDLCLPRCNFKFFHGWHKDDPCGCNAGCGQKDSCESCPSCEEGKCGKLRTRKVLLVKIRRTEEQVNKCVPGYKPECCDVAPACDGPAVMPAAPAPKAEAVPAPKAVEGKE